MIYGVVFPDQMADHRGGTLIRWHKRPGDSIEFGDDLFDVEVDQIAVLQRTKRATLIARSSRKLRRLKNDYEERTAKRSVAVTVSAAEPAHLRQILTIEGGKVRVGEAVALATTSQLEAIPSDADPLLATPLRAVVNILDPAE
ncbi:MAG TPA: hypothetical protein VFV13_08970 [Acidimicrobiia bacterium]|nr:hypothetical protein [Acidimicrobiia bacterium]